MNWLSGFTEAWEDCKGPFTRVWKRSQFWRWQSASHQAPSALKPGSAFKLANAFWHRSVACMLLQKWLVGPGRGGPKLNTLGWTPGDERYVSSPLLCACIRWISVWVRRPSCTTPQSVSGKGAQWKDFTVNPNQLLAARPPMCEETEGLCQTHREWTDLTSGYSQASRPAQLMRAKLFHHLRASRRPARNTQRCQSKIFCFSREFLLKCNLI